MAPPALWRLWRRSRRHRSSIRTVQVLPPSRANEASWVFLTAGVIVLGVIYVFAFERYDWRANSGARSERALLPFQVLFRDLPSPEQRVFRAMQEGLGEALRLRADTGNWPAVGSLAAAGIPPFAPDVLDKAGFHWSVQRADLFVNYLGVPSVPGDAPAFLILIQEPDPVTGEKAPPPSVVDEEHQLLPDGTLLHVTYWKGSPGDLRPGIIMDPAIEGWKQIRVKSPFEEIAQP